MARRPIIAGNWKMFKTPTEAARLIGELIPMVKSAAANGWLDGAGATLEIITAIKRAGADIIITYHAKEVARWLAAEK